LSELSKANLVARCRNTDCQLAPELHGGLAFEASDRFVIDPLVVSSVPEELRQIFLWKTLHADEQATRHTAVALPSLDYIIYVFPTAKVKIANAKIATAGDFQRVA